MTNNQRAARLRAGMVPEAPELAALAGDVNTLHRTGQHGNPLHEAAGEVAHEMRTH